jgi:8-oxo-dGTP pyrophosphatase MutT (NUDIX family)
MENRIRPIAICIFSNNGRILVAEGYDAVKQQTFYRPLGGSIEFGERGEETIRRELKEELGAEVVNLKYLGMAENIFVYQGKSGHEIVLMYDGEFVDKGLYERAMLEGNEFGQPFKAVWKGLDEFGPEKAPLYPDELLELLD